MVKGGERKRAVKARHCKGTVSSVKGTPAAEGLGDEVRLPQGPAHTYTPRHGSGHFVGKRDLGVLLNTF